MTPWVIFVSESVLWGCFGLIGYTYLLYPLCIWALARLPRKILTPSEADRAALPPVTLLVAAYNEEQVIERKVRNSLALDYPRDRLEIVVASDGSSDATGEIVVRYAHRGVRLLNYGQRRGKSHVLNAAIPETNGDILVLSDANTDFDRRAVRQLVRWFVDPRVQAVCGRLELKDPTGGRNVDSLYWRYETFLKHCEGRLGALLGANGGIYAIRRSGYVPIPNNAIIDDFLIPLLSKLRHGGRIVYDPAAVASEETSPTIGGEFHRRVRIGTGAYQSLRLLWRLLSPRYGWTAFAFLSHKLLRWMVPFLFLTMVVCTVCLLQYPLYRFMLGAQLALLAIALGGMYVRGKSLTARLLRATTMFAGMNLALLLGFWRWVTTPQGGTWQPTGRSLRRGV